MGKKRNYKNKREKIFINGRAQGIGALTELKDINTIAMLGQDPVYIHSYREYAQAGLRTAETYLGYAMQDVYSQVQALLPVIIEQLRIEENKLAQSFGLNNIQEFCRVWTEQIEPYYNGWDDVTANEQAALLMWLWQIKVGRLLINTQQQQRKQSGGIVETKTGWVTARADIGEVTKGPIDDIRKCVNALIKKDFDTDGVLSKIIHKFGDDQQEWNAALDKMIEAVRTGKGASSGQTPWQASLGVLYERMFEQMEPVIAQQIGNEMDVAIKMQLVAAETTGGKKSSKTFKPDNLVIIEGHPSFYLSDKTGLSYNWDKKRFNAKNPFANIQRIFTAGVDTSTFNFDKSTTAVDLPDRFDSIASYVSFNSFDAWTKESKLSKIYILCTFLWAKVVVEIVGLQKDVNEMPLFIRNFGQLYPTSDLLEIFTQISPEEIWNKQFIKQSSLESWFEMRTGQKKTIDKLTEKQRKKKQEAAFTQESKKTLKGAKRAALKDLSSRGETITYEKLKNAIKDTLIVLETETFSKKRRTLKAQFSIVLDNVSNLLKK